MANNNMPQCSRCFGTNWIDLGIIQRELWHDDIDGDAIMDSPDIHLYQCGGAEAHADSEDMKNGCMRVIRATPDEMTKGGVI
jgi:hypothetical protein